MVVGMGGGNSLEVAVESSGVGEFNGRMNSALNSLKDFRGAALAAGGALSGLGVAAGVGVSRAVGQASELETAYAEVNTIMGDGADAADQFGDTVADLSTEYATHGGEVEVVEGLYSTMSAGFTDAADAQEVMESSLIGANAGLADTETAVDAVTSILNAYNKDADESEDVTDSLFTTVQEGKTTFPELASSIGQIVPVSSDMGVGIDEVNAAVATLTAQGQSTSESVTGLRQSMTELMQPGEELEGVINDLGYESGRALVESEGFAGALELLQGHTEDSDQEMDDLFNNIRSVQAVLPLAGEASDDFSDNLDEMAEKEGNAQRAADELADTTEHRLQSAKNEASSAVNALGMAFIDQLLPAMEAGTDVLSDVSSWFRNLDESTQGVIASVTLTGTVMTTLSGAVLLVSAALPTLAALLSGPLVAGLAAVIGAVAALTVAWETDFMGIQQVTRDVVSQVVDLWESGVEFLREFWEENGEQIVQTFNEYGDQIETRLEMLADAVLTVAAPVMEIMRDLWDDHARDIAESIISLSEVLLERMELIAQVVTDVATPVIERMREFWEDNGEQIVEFVGVMTSDIMEFLTWLFDNLIELNSWFNDQFRSAWELLGDDVIAIVEFFTDVLFTSIENFITLFMGAWTAFTQLLRGDTDEAFSTIYETVSTLLSNTYEFFSGWGTRFLSRAWEILKSVLGAFRDFALDIIGSGGSIIKSLFSDIGSYITSTGKTIVENGIDGVVTTVTDAFDNMKETVLGTIGMLFTDAREAFRNGMDSLLTIFNNVLPDSVSVPEVSIGGQSIDVPSVEVAGQTIGGGSLSVPSADIGGQSMNFPQLDTGGFIDDEGLAMLHAGEEVVPKAEVSDREEGTGGDTYNVEVHANNRSDGRQAGKAFTKELRSKM